MILKYQRQGPKPNDIAHSLYLYFPGLSHRNATKALSRVIHRSYVSAWKWIQKYKPMRISSKRNKIDGFIIDETQVKVISKLIWLWVAIEPEHRQVLKNRHALGAKYAHCRAIYIVSGEQIGPASSVSTDGGKWYPQACKFLRIKNHHIYSSFEKSLIERTMQVHKGQDGMLDDFFPCSRKKCKLKHVKNWFNPFIDQHDKEVLGEQSHKFANAN